jgi:outer membrane protein assembly factor BamB
MRRRPLTLPSFPSPSVGVAVVGAALLAALTMVVSAPMPVRGDNPMLGGNPSRNGVNTTEKDIAVSFSVKKGMQKNVKWEAQLGDKSYSVPVIADGRVFVATNNAHPRDPADKDKDLGVVMCFDEKTGRFLWQHTHEKLENQKQDTAHEGVAATPTVDGNRVYYVSNRCEVVCLDVAGNPDKPGKAKVIWTVDMIARYGVFPCQLANCSPLVVGDTVYVITGNGVDINTNKVPAPKAPSFLALNKKTGELIWKSDLPSAATVRGQWSNPSAVTANGKMQILFAGGDGWLYSLEPKTGELIWKFDCNPKTSQSIKEKGKPISPYKVGGSGEKCFIVCTPVVVDNLVYIAVGQEPDDQNGIGHLWCIDASKKPTNKEKDLSPVNDNFDPKAEVNKDSGLVWHLGGERGGDGNPNFFGRTLSSPVVANGLLYATDITGFLYCVDAKTGKTEWEFDLQEGTWCGPACMDGKVYVGTASGELYILEQGRKMKQLAKVSCGGPITQPAVACHGVLFVNNGSMLYAIK